MKHTTGSKFIFFSIIAFSLFAFAINGRTTYQAKIIKPDGQPLQASSVNFRFSVLDPVGTCVLYVEEYTAVNMTDSGGVISFSLGAGTRLFPTSGTSKTFQNTFDNSIASLSCQSPGIYNPGPTDPRKIAMQFNDGAGWQTLPAMSINAVPYAMFSTRAQDAEKLNGKDANAFVENATLAALNCNTATQAITFNGVSFSCITVGASSTVASMSSDGYITAADYADFKTKLSASSTQIINTLGYTPVSSATVASQIASSTLAGDVSGNPGANTVNSVGGKTATQIATSVNDTLAASSANGTGTIVKRDSSGNFTANDIYASSTKTNAVDIFKPFTGLNIRLQAPSSLTANYVLSLPTTSGTTGQVLATDGLGQLSWINPSTGSVVSVSATAPLLSSGGSTPTISITQSTSSANGYLSATDWTTFNNKQQATSSAIIATLGYTPANNASLGTFATANTIDLSSASATGIIADARLANQTNVTSGTQYTKVTVDGKGRVVSGAQLTSSDVTTALGFTPGAAASGVTSLNGSTSQTQTFANGTAGTTPAFVTTNGVHTLNIPLASAASVTGGLLSNADYTTFMGKITSSAASIAQVLGYTPASATQLGNYLIKANNLSDLSSSSSARTNLGLGDLAIANTIDLGSASATGIIADARLANQANVTSGTQYTKVTVDGKGRVISGTQLTSSDVTTALGFTPGAAASGVTSLNGSTSQTQSFATGVTGTAPAFNTAAGVHTLNIPLASAASVTAGLLSNADYTTFMSKITSSAASIAQVLGYTPANSANLGTFATANTIDLGSASATGIIADARLASQTNVVSGTPYTKVTVDGKGRVTSGAQLSSSDIATALGYTPANSATVVPSQWNTVGATINYMAGNVGVGISSPNYKLTIDGTAASDRTIAVGSVPVIYLPVQGTNPNEFIGSVAFGDGLRSISSAYGDKGQYNTATGIGALHDDATGGWNTANGYQALNKNTDGSNNVAMGMYALLSNTTGNLNTALGTQSMQSNTMGTMNTAVGVSSLRNNTTGTYNTATGRNSLLNLTTGLGNSALGSEALLNLPAGDYNSAVGYQALYSAISTASFNVAMGYLAGRYDPSYSELTSVSSSVYVGANTKSFGNGVTNENVFGYNATGAGSNTVTIGDPNIVKTIINGKLGLGVSAPAYKLDVSGDVNVTGNFRVNGVSIGSSGITGSGTTTKIPKFTSSGVIADSNITDNGTTVTISTDANIYGITAGRGAGARSANTAFGANALLINSTGNNNTAIGSNAMLSNLGGNANTATGSYALAFNTSGDQNTAIGYGALYKNTTATMNTAVGYQTLNSNTTGAMNIAMGYQALYTNQVSNYNVAIGTYALYSASATSNANNTAIGSLALQNMTTGTNNLGIGYGAGSAITTGVGNVVIGANTGAIVATSNSTIILSDGGGNIRLFVDTTGKMGIGTTSPTAKLDVSGTVNIASGSALTFGGNTICTAGGCTATSDVRLKENIEPLDFSLEKILQLNAVQYDWKDKAVYGDKHQVGFIAQDLEKVYPEVVYTDKNTGLKTVAYGNLVAPVVEAIKSLYEQKRQMASEIENLKIENSALKAYLCSKDPAAPICK